MMIDTDVLIWYLRGSKKSRDIINENIPFTMSVINYMELLQGMKDKGELRTLKKYLKKWSTDVMQINESISTRAMFLMEDYCLSHSMELSDAIIAATSLENREILLTANDKHYRFIPNIQIHKFNPF